MPSDLPNDPAPADAVPPAPAADALDPLAPLDRLDPLEPPALAAAPEPPVSKVKEWAVAIAIMIVFGIICAQFIGFLRSNQYGP